MGNKINVILAHIPETVDEAHWMDEDYNGETRDHFANILKSFNNSMIRCIKKGSIDDLREYIGQDTNFYSKYGIEGAGMAFALLYYYKIADFDILQNNRYYDNPAVKQLFYYGYGMGMAFVKVSFTGLEQYSDSKYLNWIRNGFGFYHNILNKSKLTSMELKYFRGIPRDDDYLSGLGRALWFVKGSSPGLIRSIIDIFPIKEQDAVWQGIGIAMSFSGGVPGEKLKELRALAGNREESVKKGILEGMNMREDNNDEKKYAHAAYEVFYESGVISHDGVRSI